MKHLFRFGLAALGLVAVSTMAYSDGHSKFEKQIKARKAVMQVYSFNIGGLAAMAKAKPSMMQRLLRNLPTTCWQPQT